MNGLRIPVVCVVGPTASGKTTLAVELAKRLNGEIISADSMQIYRGMDIVTAKVSGSEKQGIPHYLIDILDPDEEFSVADFTRLASEAIDDIRSRGKIPIIAGGTGLYISSLIDNIRFPETARDNDIRASLESEYDSVGGENMLKMLSEFDPDCAQALHPNDKKRIVRAIEVYRVTGHTRTELDKASRSAGSPYEPYIVGLFYSDRSKLYERIDRRVDIMLSQGLVDEAVRIMRRYGKNSRTAGQAIGYKELLPYLKGEISLEEAAEKIKLETRKYAKRQLSWFRRDKRIVWLDMMYEQDPDKIAGDIMSKLTY